ncbi:hypothetical protein FVA74_07640 [Salinibacterium sp. dk2585]|uniref:hypothetical protein n=1 Tax=unclassified Salinibacterium TaxID=2632331 RepID=UPI0011C24384|nr:MULTISPECIES: hypothetical protein [unclassified Salinibacterium]QEE61464.1 hypothetical protein FVA74_07640 [Salinibacterium sp. dk2585]TXK54141.1 hypothetical protein FVP63_09090 [Salinibacterium sp. dk5596]
MQLGTRWSVGAESPDRLPAPVRDAIRGVDEELLALASETFDPTTWRWTLTWLEGRPIAELDDGTVVMLDAAGGVLVTPAG